MSEEFTFYKKLGRQVADLLCLTSDRLGFYRTKDGMKTAQGIGEAVSKMSDELKKEVDSE